MSLNEMVIKQNVSSENFLKFRNKLSKHNLIYLIQKINYDPKNVLVYITKAYSLTSILIVIETKSL